MEKKTKKELIQQYNAREIVGGIYVIKNTCDGTVFLDASKDIRASKNRFDFSQKMEVCPIGKIKKDWDKLGSGLFVFETLEEYVKNESSSDREFLNDLGELKTLWSERLSEGGTAFY
jgi:hypothetical protein